jgi:hypothetical protein
MNIKNCVFFFTSFVLFSCIPSLDARRQAAQGLADDFGFEEKIIQTTDFSFFTYQKNQSASKALNIYIEGDGFAWKNKYTVSKNPTPINPVALKLAASDKSEGVIYMARPCQYVDLAKEKNCDEKFWSEARFSKKIILSMSDAINQIKRSHKSNSINLYGFSGGANVALLLASIRNDIKSITTIAGNLDNQALVKFHDISDMEEFMSVDEIVKNTKSISQCHIAGDEDKIVPYFIQKNFVKKINENGGIAGFRLIKGAGHNYEKWDEVLQRSCI